MDTLAPFANCVLERPVIDGIDETSEETYTWLMPATTRTTDYRIIRPSLDCLQQELIVTRLDDIAAWLWVCGRPMPPRPLHYQLLLSREVNVTENVELHLIWSRNRMFLKPVPLYLLNQPFRKAFFSPTGAQPQYVRECAYGFLFAYCALIRYESDFRIAQNKGLLPPDMKWPEWKILTAQLLQDDIYASVNPRYLCGELRLDRLNRVYKFRKVRLLRGYASIDGHRQYSEFFSDNFALIASLLGYYVIVLTAMQVGLQTDRLQPSLAFQNASYGFKVFSIVAPLVAAAEVLLAVLILFIGNFFATKNLSRNNSGDGASSLFGRRNGDRRSRKDSMLERAEAARSPCQQKMRV